MKKLQGLELLNLLNMGGTNTGVPYLGMHVKYTVAVPEKYVVSIDMCHCQKKNIIVKRNGTAQTRSSESEKKKKKVR